MDFIGFVVCGLLLIVLMLLLGCALINFGRVTQPHNELFQPLVGLWIVLTIIGIIFSLKFLVSIFP